MDRENVYALMMPTYWPISIADVPIFNLRLMALTSQVVIFRPALSGYSLDCTKLSDPILECA